MQHSSQSSARPQELRRTLVIMAKAPRPGMVKTRLAQSLPQPAVMSFYRCVLDDTITLAKSLREVNVAVMCPASHEDELASMIGDRVQVVAQEGEGLAAGLTSVFRRFTEQEPQQVIAFNSDSPHLAPTVLDQAFEILNTHDVVVGPTHDGGYYLVGAKSAHPTLFAGDGLGTRSALERLVERTNALGLSTGYTEPFYDIDIADDLMRLAEELRRAPGKAPRTAAWCTEWAHELVARRSGEGKP